MLMLSFNDRNINYLESMRVCDVVDNSTIEDQYYSNNVITTLWRLLDSVYSPADHWRICPLHNKCVRITCELNSHAVLIREDGSMVFES